SHARIEALQQDREQVNAQTAGLLAQKQAQDADITACEDALREDRRTLTELQERRGVLEVEMGQKEKAVQTLRERVHQKYQVRLDDIRSECITITFADEGPPKVHVMTPEEMAAAGAATDWNEVAKQVEALQARIDEMGPVNLVAIEEYE